MKVVVGKDFLAVAEQFLLLEHLPRDKRHGNSLWRLWNGAYRVHAVELIGVVDLQNIQVQNFGYGRPNIK